MLSKTPYKSVRTKKPDLDFFEKMFFNNAFFVETKNWKKSTRRSFIFILKKMYSSFWLSQNRSKIYKFSIFKFCVKSKRQGFLVGGGNTFSFMLSSNSAGFVGPIFSTLRPFFGFFFTSSQVTAQSVGLAKFAQPCIASDPLRSPKKDTFLIKGYNDFISAFARLRDPLLVGRNPENRKDMGTWYKFLILVVFFASFLGGLTSFSLFDTWNTKKNI